MHEAGARRGYPLAMQDRLVRGLFAEAGLRAVFVRAGDTARMARMLHGLAPTSARLFAEGLAGALLVAALLEDRSRVNLQVECDGPVRGLFVDASPEGEVRGYVRAPGVHFPGDPRRGARAALGTSGSLSVLRDLGGGQFYRGAVELRELDLAGDLRRYFSESEQVETALDIQVLARGAEPLGDAAGIMVQRLPDGDDGSVAAVRERLAGGSLAASLARGASAQGALRAAAGPGFELLADQEVASVCGCSPARARVAVSALGRGGVEQILAEERQATVTCEFCRKQYLVGESELREIAGRLAAEPG
jgi:molecular chaperone Hsp33